MAILALLAPALLGADGPPHPILAGIPDEPGPFSKEEREVLHERLAEVREAIAEADPEEALGLIRRALAGAPPGDGYAPPSKRKDAYHGAVSEMLLGIHARYEPPVQPSYLALLREFVATVPIGYHVTGSAMWDTAVLNWTAGFVQMHGDDAIALAAGRVNDSSLPPVDRGLHMMVFGNRLVLGRDWDHPQRPLALETYRPYLDPSAPPIMQEMAVMAAKGLWDYDALPALKRLAFNSPNYHALNRAYHLVGDLYIRGPRREHALRPAMEPGIEKGPYDRAAAHAWAERSDEHYRELARLTGTLDLYEQEKALEAARRAREAREFRALSPAAPRLRQPRPPQRVVPRDQ